MADKFEHGDKTVVNNKVFTCSDCGCHCLEEIMTDVAVATTIQEVDGPDVMHGDDVENHGGFVNRIQCWNCGKVIADEDNGNLAYENLVETAKEW